MFGKNGLPGGEAVWEVQMKAHADRERKARMKRSATTLLTGDSSRETDSVFGTGRLRLSPGEESMTMG